MPKIKKKLTPEQKRLRKAAKAGRKKKFQWVFMNGKQVKIKRPPTIDGVDVDDFIRENADPPWLHQNGMHEILHEREFAEAGRDPDDTTENIFKN